MKILSISYHNYRCFLNEHFDFGCDRDQNITLVIGPNTCGKSEMLVSMMWVLYDFDFKILEGKEEMNYSLNQDLYDALDVSQAGTTESCWVEMIFESDGRKYRIKRTEIFKKLDVKIISNLEIELSSERENGTWSLPERDLTNVVDRLSSIIPPNIMSGIMFDGERMKKLNTTDDNARKAVQGVISQISNLSLYDIIRGQLDSLKKDLEVQRKKVTRTIGNKTVANLNTQINSLETTIEQYKRKIESSKKDLELTENRLSEIALELSQNKQSKNYQEQRIALQKELKEYQGKLAKSIDYFYKDLGLGFYLICDTLFDDVRNLLSEDSDIPMGLTVDAVDSILQRGVCICGCGHSLTETERDNLKKLREKLPPENVNSTLLAMVKANERYLEETEDKLERCYEPIEEWTDKIDEIRTKINDISNILASYDSEHIATLETENNKKTEKRNRLADDIQQWESLRTQREEELAKLKNERQQRSQGDEELQRLEKKEAIIQKYMEIVAKMADNTKLRSWKDINVRLNEAFSLLSEDYQHGRRLYIVQFDNSQKYRMIAYNETMRDTILERHKKEIGAMRLEGKSEDEIEERVILWMARGSSTGQTTINSLAFSKAILDYANAERSEGDVETRKSYPLLIDSPFSSISNENLKNTAEHIHEFADQVIMMTVSKDFHVVEPYIMPYVKQKIELSKKK